MIFYFSGTGNSQLAAKQIAETIGDEIISMNQYMREGKRGTFRSERPFIFVTPTYAWRMPKVVEQWIRESGFEGSRDAYFVLTCGGDVGNAGVYARKLCAAKGFCFHGLEQVVMPENYVAMFPTPDETECQALIEKAKPCIDELAALIRDKKDFPERAVSMKEKVESGPVNLIFYPLFVHDKGFTVSDQCVSCGKCAKRCPLVNIDMVDGKPRWKGNCTHCMACIGGCPVGAIEYKKVSKGQHKYYIMED